MSFLTVNGFNVDAYRDNFERNYTDVQSFDRTEGTTYEGVLFATKREWTFEVPWEPLEAKAIAIRDWIKGRGHYWTFDRVDGATVRFNKYSSEGGPSFAAFMSGGTPVFGTWGGSVASAQTSSTTISFGSENKYTVSLWKLMKSTTPVLCSAVWDGATLLYSSAIKNGAVGNTTAFAWATIGSASGVLSLALKGQDEAGTNTTAWYDGVMMVPYAMSTPQLTARASRTAAEPVFPYVEIDGDALEDLFPVVVKGFVENERMQQVNSAGVQNARLMKVHFVEK